VETLITALGDEAGIVGTLMPEAQAVYECARQTISIAELSSRLMFPLGVIRVLVSDLAEQDLIFIHPTGYSYSYDLNILERILDGLRKLPV